MQDTWGKAPSSSPKGGGVCAAPKSLSPAPLGSHGVPGAQLCLSVSVNALVTPSGNLQCVKDTPLSVIESSHLGRAMERICSPDLGSRFPRFWPWPSKGEVLKLEVLCPGILLPGSQQGLCLTRPRAQGLPCCPQFSLLCCWEISLRAINEVLSQQGKRGDVSEDKGW